MATQMPVPPSWSTGDILYSTTLTTAFSNITTYANSYMGWLEAAQTWSGANTFSASPVLSAQNALTFSHATGRIIPGATSLTIRDTANANDNLILTNAGALTTRSTVTVTAGGLTVTAGGVTVTAGGLTVTTGGLTVAGGATSVQGFSCTTFSASGAITFAQLTGSGASPKILIGSSSLLFRNAADTTSYLSVLATGIGVSGTVSAGDGDFSGTLAAVSLTTASVLASATNNLVLGTASPIATSATVGFPLIPCSAGIPSGAAANGALCADSTGNKVYCYLSGSWRVLN